MLEMFRVVVLCCSVNLSQRQLSSSEQWFQCTSELIPCTSAMLIRNWFLSSNTILRPCSMKASKRLVNSFMLARSSSNLKFRGGSDSAIDGEAEVLYGGRNSVDVRFWSVTSATVAAMTGKVSSHVVR